MSKEESIVFYGFSPVPRDPDVLFANVRTADPHHPKQDKWTIDDFPFPDSPLVRDVKNFVKKELNEPTWNHSNRVYVFGQAIVRSHFPNWSYDAETYYLTCLLHDIGTAEKYLTTSKLSFDFKGAIVARDLLLQLADKHHSQNIKGRIDQADSVAEAIIRHQDIFVSGGNITTIGQVIQLATALDVAGRRIYLLHPSLIESVTRTFPNTGWLECFASTIETELGTKPWCHSSTFEEPNFQLGKNGHAHGPDEWKSDNFANNILGNGAMRAYYQ